MAFNINILNVGRDERIGSAFNELFRIIHLTESAEEAIEWDFSSTSFLHPFFVAPLAIFLDNSKKDISCTGFKTSISGYFSAIKFENTYDASQLNSLESLNSYLKKSYIPISKFKIKGSDIDKIEDILQQLIEKQSKVALDMKNPISHLLSELIDNIGEHSGSEYGYLFCQKVKQELYIVIADVGRTIYGSYVDTGKYLNEIGDDEAKALKIANDGYSTKDRPEAENRGYGISKSREMVVDGLGGAFFMLSGTAFYRHDKNGANIVNIPKEYRWDGTIALIRIPLKAPDVFDFYKYVE